MSKKVEPYGGNNGDAFDDGVYELWSNVVGVDGDGVRKMCVGEDGGRVCYLAFEYVIGSLSITFTHGNKPQEEPKVFTLNYLDDEYIKSVEGTYDEDGFISSLIFKTSKERKSEEFGEAATTKFVLEAKGFDELIEFLGRSSDDGIHALGAYFAVVVAPPVKKLKAKGGDFESDDEEECSDDSDDLEIRDEWDDGVHDNVREIVTVVSNGISVDLVKFEYVNGTESVTGEAHGKISPLPTTTEKFVLREDEYITSVKGHYDKKFPPVGPLREFCELGYNYMTMLIFKTNIRTYEVIGRSPDQNYEGTSFVLEEKDHKIVGFHGSSTCSLEQIGVYVKPINNS